MLQAEFDPAAEACPGRPYTSAKVRTYGKFAVGPSSEHPVVKVEARIKVPAGPGLWPAFWMLPEDGASPYCSGQGQHGGWAASGEVDVMETGNDARMVGSCSAFATLPTARLGLQGHAQRWPRPKLAGPAPLR